MEEMGTGMRTLFFWVLISSRIIIAGRKIPLLWACVQGAGSLRPASSPWISIPALPTGSFA
jgi:hypothetical protein